MISQEERDALLDELIDFNNENGLYEHDKDLLPKKEIE